jgi:hypothetical protein
VLTNFERTIALWPSGTMRFFSMEQHSRCAIRRAAMQLADALSYKNPSFKRDEFLNLVGGPSLLPEIKYQQVCGGFTWFMRPPTAATGDRGLHDPLSRLKRTSRWSRPRRRHDVQEVRSEI